MAFSLRLPPDLDREARIRSEQIGVPLNGLICFALDLYLRGGGSAARPEPVVVDSLDFENPRRVSYGGAPLKRPVEPSTGSSKAERRAFTANQRLLRKSGN